MRGWFLPMADELFWAMPLICQGCLPILKCWLPNLEMLLTSVCTLSVYKEPFYTQERKYWSAVEGALRKEGTTLRFLASFCERNHPSPWTWSCSGRSRWFKAFNVLAVECVPADSILTDSQWFLEVKAEPQICSFRALEFISLSLVHWMLYTRK